MTTRAGPMRTSRMAHCALLGGGATWLAVACCVAACGQRAEPERRSTLVQRLLAEPEGAASAPIAARMGETAIQAEEVALRLRKRRADGDASATARDVAFDLALEELAAREARKQQLAGDADVLHAVRQALVEVLIEKGFEPEATAAHIPEDYLKRSFEKNIRFYNNPELRGYEHLLVWAPLKGGKVDASKQAATRALAESFLPLVKARKPTSLKALADELSPRAKAQGLELRYETAVTSRESVEKDFADVLFETPAGEVGARVAESRFGSHVLMCTRIKERVHKTFAEVREDVRTRSYPAWRQYRFMTWTQQLRANYRAEVADMAHLLFRNQKRPAAPKP